MSGLRKRELRSPGVWPSQNSIIFLSLGNVTLVMTRNRGFVKYNDKAPFWGALSIMRIVQPYLLKQKGFEKIAPWL